MLNWPGELRGTIKQLKDPPFAETDPFPTTATIPYHSNELNNGLEQNGTRVVQPARPLTVGKREWDTLGQNGTRKVSGPTVTMSAPQQSRPSSVRRPAPWVFYYDGDCGFCLRWVNRLRRLDRAGQVSWVAFQSLPEPPRGVTWDDLKRAAYLDPHPDTGAGPLHEGFYAFRQLSRRIPLLFPLAPLFWLPGMGRLGQPVYRWIAANRYRLSCRHPSVRG